MDPGYTHQYTNNNYMCELSSDPVLNTNYIYLNLYSDLVRQGTIIIYVLQKGKMKQSEEITCPKSQI